MDPKKKERLEKNGWKVGTAEEFLELPDGYFNEEVFKLSTKKDPKKKLKID